MPQVQFEIRDQQGLCRIGRFKSGKIFYYTPNLIFPINEFENLSYSLKKENSSSSNQNSLRFEDYKNLIKNTTHSFLASLTVDPLGLFSNNNFISPEHEQSYQIIENLDLFGVYSINKLKNTEYPSSSQSSINTLNYNLLHLPNSSLFPDNTKMHFHVLSANFPNTDYNRYESYEKALIQHRLDFYSSQILAQNLDDFFILEIPFTTQKSIMNLYLSWVQNHQDQLFGLKFTNIFRNLRNQLEILEWIFTFKMQTSPNLMWIAGGQIFPQNYALAIYLGFDCIETNSLFYYSYQGLYITSQSSQWLRNLQFPPCACPACQHLERLVPGTGSENLEQLHLILYHNIFTARTEIRRIEQYLSEGSLRSYLEAQTHTKPEFAAIVRLIDKYYANEINSRYKLCNSHKVDCIGVESYFRPEVQNFIQRVKNEITPAQKYQIVVILPCAAKKPYSQSKSHQYFRKVIRKTMGKEFYSQVHQVIITSPLGVVPRELEHIFPAAHYDIPVTGDWDEYEINLTGKLLANWLNKYQNIKDENTGKDQNTGEDENASKNNHPLIIVAHVHGGYYSACKVAEDKLKLESKNIIWRYTLIQEESASPSSKIGLKALENTLNEIKLSWVLSKKDQITNKDKQSKKILKKNIFQSLTEAEIMIRANLDYQFGKGAGDLFMDTGIIVNKCRNPQYFEVFTYDGAGKFQIGRLHTNSGFLRLTPRGAQRLISHGRNFVKITEPTMKGTTVFIPILDNMDSLCHPGDEVIVLNSNNEYLGVGELIRAPADLRNIKYGLVCKLRKKVKDQHFSTSSTDVDLLKEIEQ